MKEMIMSLLKEENGQGMAEYGLILALVAVIVAAALTTMQTNLSTLFQTVGDKVKPASP